MAVPEDEEENCGGDGRLVNGGGLRVAGGVRRTEEGFTKEGQGPEHVHAHKGGKTEFKEIHDRA